MRTKLRRAGIVLALCGAGAVAAGRAGTHPAEQRSAHDCERVELFYPTSTSVMGTSGCTPHNGGHVCVGDATTEIAVVVCRD